MSNASLFESLEKREMLTTVPAAPTNLKCVGRSASSLTIQWVDNSGNEKGFNIYRSFDGATFNFLNTMTPNTTSYVNGKLKTGKHVWYRVTAFNKAGESKSKKTAEGVPLAPVDINAPSNLKASSSSATAIKLTWADNADNENGFLIQRSMDGVNFKALNTVGQNITEYVNGKLATGTEYWYRVLAVNDAGSSDPSNVASATPAVSQPPPPALPAPTGLTAASASATSITLNWTDISGDNGYKVERSTDNQTFTQIGTTGTSVVTFTDSGLTTGTTYYYRVRGVTSTGANGAYSVSVSATPTIPPLAAPSNLTTSAIGSSAIELKWKDNTTTEQGFKIERSSDGKTYTQVFVTVMNQTTYIDGNLKANTKYYYRVRATDGTQDSAYSNVSSRTTNKATQPPPNDGTHDWANGGTADYATGKWYFDGVSVTTNADPAQTIPLLKQLHVGSVRIWFTKTESWDPASSPPDGLAIAKAYKAAGFRVLMVVGDDKVPTYDQAVAFFQYVANQPGILDAVDLFEIGNEPNQPAFWKGTAQQYVDIYEKAGWDVFHNLGKTVVGAGPTFDVNYCQTLAADGYLNYCDIADFHPYGSSPDQIYQRATGAIAAFAGKPTMFTEWNIRNTAGLADWASKVDAARKLLATTGADSAFYFTMFVANTLGGNGGLVNLADYTPHDPFFTMYKTWGDPPPAA